MSGPTFDQITDAVRGAIAYLADSQLSAGEFPTYWSKTRSMSSPTYVESAFIMGMILLALSSLEGERIDRIKQKGIAYLRAKRKENGYFSFIPSSSSASDGGMDCDLDDTCLLNWILQTEDPDKSFYQALASRVARLPKRHGLYETWIRENPNADNDIDPCVNVNVLRFLDHNDVKCDGVIQALREVLLRGDYIRGTIYYESGYAFPYLLFTLPPKLRDQIIGGRFRDSVQRLILPRFGSERPPFIIDAAMKLLVMCVCKAPYPICAALAADILAWRKPNIGWPSWAVFRAFNFWGSSELTTAIVAQALWHYRNLL